MAKYTLETERLILRPPDSDDIDAWTAKLFSDPDVMRHMPKRDLTPREDAERALSVSNRLWASSGYGGWAIINKFDGQIIGRCGLGSLEDADDVELGYALAKAYWGQGLATEAARACVRFGFETAKLKKIIAVVVPENTASWRVLEHIGFVFEKKAVYYDLDVVYYVIKPDGFHYGDSFYQAQPLEN